ncbi:CRISPR-associated endonuclease Cas1 [bacterium]|nr:CRISPR-associated endonuclease Cas1 [candidate division CSSED10-310 bacterium]
MDNPGLTTGGVPTLCIMGDGAQVRKRDRTLLVMRRDQVVAEVPVFQVKRIFAFGAVSFTQQALTVILENGIDVSLFSRGRRLQGKIVGMESKNVYMRLAQYERWRDTESRTNLARDILRGKLGNQRTLLRRFHRRQGGTVFDQAAESVDSVLARLDEAKDGVTLMGLEGTASATYFSAYKTLFSEEMGFDQRRRRPPPDPVNALLSLGYTMLTNEAASVIEGLALDPYIGFLHGIKYGRKSLALDLIEEFRHPVVDVLTTNLCTRGILTAADFQVDAQVGCRLTEAALKRYFESYQDFMTRSSKTRGNDDGEACYQALILGQAQRFMAAVMSGGSYQPFRVR